VVVDMPVSPEFLRADSGVGLLADEGEREEGKEEGGRRGGGRRKSESSLGVGRGVR